jgi:hypothetical protein
MGCFARLLDILCVIQILRWYRHYENALSFKIWFTLKGMKLYLLKNFYKI